MADITVEVGTQIRFFVSGSFSPVDAATDWTIGTPTDVVMTMASLADTAARQSDKFDFGANRANRYECLSSPDFTDEAPTTGERLDYYLAPSTSATQANGNVAGNSGADAAAPGGALGSITLAEFLRQCQYIGPLINHNGGVVQNGHVGVFSPSSRYAQLIVVNESGDVLEADDVETHTVFNPLVDDVA